MRILTKFKYAKSILVGRFPRSHSCFLPLSTAWLSSTWELAEIAVGGGVNTSYAVRRDAALALALRCKPRDYWIVAKVISDAMLKGYDSDITVKQKLNVVFGFSNTYFADALIRQAGVCAVAPMVDLHPGIAVELFHPVSQIAFSRADGNGRYCSTIRNTRVEAFDRALPALMKADPTLAQESRGIFQKTAWTVQSINEHQNIRDAAQRFISLLTEMKPVLDIRRPLSPKVGG